MGKAKKGRALSKNTRVDPLGGARKPESQSSGPKPEALMLLEELRSADVARKESAVVALAEVLSKTHATEEALNGGPAKALVEKLLEDGVVGLLIERMFDTTSQVRLHAAGALRNMAAIGDSVICSKMMKADVMTALLGLINKADTEEPLIVAQGLAALADMCDTVEDALKAFTRSQGLVAVLGILTNFQASGHVELLTQAAWTLRTATDGNYALCEQLCRSQEALAVMSSLLNADSPLPPPARVNLAGAWVHIYLELCRTDFTDAKSQPFPTNPRADVMLRQVLESISPCLTFDLQALQDVLAAVDAVTEASVPPQEEAGSAMEEDGGEGGDEERGDGDARMDEGGEEDKPRALQEKRERKARRKVWKSRLEEAEKQLTQARERWSESIVPVRLAMEVFANVVGADPGDGDEEVEWGSDDDEEQMERVAEQGQASAASGSRGVDTDMFAVLQTTGVLGRATESLKHLAACLVTHHSRLDQVPIQVMRDVLDLRQRAVVAVGNVMSELHPQVVAAEAGGLWSDMKVMTAQALQEESVPHQPWYKRGEEPWLGLLTGVMTALLRKAPQLAQTEDVEMMSMLLSTGPFHEVRVNAAAMLGVVGAANHGLAEAVGRTFKDAIMKEGHVLVEAEVLNAVMDIFSEDELQPIFMSLGLLPLLKDLLPKFRVKAKTEALKHGREACAHVKETALNLSRFIKYHSVKR